MNLRAEASTSAEIVTVLTRGERLVISGDSTEADGYTWYPVEVEESGETGFVASSLLDLVA